MLPCGGIKTCQLYIQDHPGLGRTSRLHLQGKSKDGGETFFRKVPTTLEDHNVKWVFLSN
jgi:hypothetical protein